MTDPGKPGEVKELELRLKILADVGLVGLPNAGKSTLLAALTRAFPKIAAYPFTTLRPYIGHVKFVDGFNMSLADLPGLIKGASQNKGLGHAFLQHVERTKALLYVLDGTGQNEHSPLNAFQTLRSEINIYDEKVYKKKSLIALNKCDLAEMSDQTYWENYDELQVGRSINLRNGMREQLTSLLYLQKREMDLRSLYYEFEKLWRLRNCEKIIKEIYNAAQQTGYVDNDFDSTRRTEDEKCSEYVVQQEEGRMLQECVVQWLP